MECKSKLPLEEINCQVINRADTKAAFPFSPPNHSHYSNCLPTDPSCSYSSPSLLPSQNPLNMAIVSNLIINQFGLILKVLLLSQYVESRDYRTENYFQVGPLTTERQSEQEELTSWTYTWTEAYCHPGTFVTGYNLRYHKEKPGRSKSLENISLLCSKHQSLDENADHLETKILHFGEDHTDEEDEEGELSPWLLSRSENGPDFIRSSSKNSTSYANGFISLKMMSRGQGNGWSDRLFELRHGFSFHQQPLRWSIETVERPEEQPLDSIIEWNVEEINVFKCTKGFSICGAAAKIGRKSNSSFTDSKGEGNSYNCLDFVSIRYLLSVVNCGTKFQSDFNNYSFIAVTSVRRKKFSYRLPAVVQTTA